MPARQGERAADNVSPTGRLPWRLERSGSRRAGSERHRGCRVLVWFISIILAGAIGLTLSQMYWLITTPVGISVRQERETAEAVYQFYDAVSAVLQTGDSRLIADSTSSTFVNHVALPGATSDRDGLVRYLAGWHEIGQETSIVVVEMNVVRDKAMVRLAVNRVAPVTVFGLALSDPAALWSTTDVLRIERHQVAERWSGEGHYAGLQSLGSGAINIAEAEREVVTLERVVLNEGMQIHVPMTVRAILLESGTIQKMHFSDRRPDLPISQIDTLRRSDGVIPIPGATSLANVGPGAATFLAIRVAELDSLTNNEERFGLPAPIASPWSTYVVARTLVSAVPASPLKDVITIAVGRLTLSPDEELSAYVSSEVILALCEVGDLTIDLTHGTAWVHSASDGNRHEYTDGRFSMTSGDGIQISTGSVMTLQAPSVEPVTVMMVVLSARTSM